jgi:hypothetical protein
VLLQMRQQARQALGAHRRRHLFQSVQQFDRWQGAQASASACCASACAPQARAQAA